MNSSREFMPGPCAYDPEVADAFQAIEAGRADAAAESLARVACGGCLQRPYCQEQQSDIALQIAKRQTTRVAMITGETIDMQPVNDRAASLSTLEKLQDPSVRFDIQSLPVSATPAERLDLVRQAFRARQLRLEGRPPAQLEAFKTIAEGHTRDLGGLTEQTASGLVAIGAKMAMRYRSYSLTRDWANKPLRDDEIEAAFELFNTYYADALVLAKAGIPGQGAVYHQPKFYTNLLKVESRSKALSKAIIEREIKRSVADPVAALSQRLERHRASRYSEPGLKKHGVNRRKIAEQTHSPVQAMERAAAQLQDLQPKYPQAANVLGYFITAFPQDPEAALCAYLEVRPMLAQDQGLTHLGAEYLDKIAKRHPFTAIEVARTTTQRIKLITDTAEQADIPFSMARAKHYALSKAPITQETVQGWAHYDRARTILNGKNVPQWVGVKIAETVAYDKQGQTATFAHNLLARKLLAPRMTFDGLKEKVLSWTEEAAYLTEDEKLAVLHTTNMSHVMGIVCDAEYLQAALGTDNLKKLVHQVLVPDLFPPDPRDILASIRYSKRHESRAKEDAADIYDTHREAIAACIQAEINDEHAARGLTDDLIRSLMLAYPTGTYYPSRDRLSTAAILDQAVRPYVRHYQSGRTLNTVKVYLRKNPDWDSEVFSYIDDLSGLPGDIRREVARISIPLTFIRRCQRNAAYLNSRDDLNAFNNSDRAILIKGSTEDIEARIDATLTAFQHYRGDLWATASSIKQVYLRHSLKDVETTLQSGIQTARKLYAQYGTRVERSECALVAFRRQNPHKYLDTKVKQMDDILFAHHRAAHLTDYVTYRLADRHNTRPIAEEVAAYAERYEYAQNILAIHNMSGSKEVVARLAITRRDLRSLEASTDAYITASKNYATVDEIEQWMVDTAFMQPSIVLAWRYLATLQNKLRRSLSFDQPVGEQSTLGDIVGQTDSNLAAVEYDGNETDSSDAQKQALILSKLANLDIVDQAAVLAAFDLHDLMNRDMLLQELDDISILCQKLGVTDPTSLAFYVQARVLPKIRED